ncbi:hypothetical protein CBER1_09894 [Cercospora berteroae]|uniref:Uncharacterized protein n=1 Tax=Cercospora berteroae TaxID=357750 RepID=A0A2S6CJN4_9PEZI|nr:hypothetical protein CBER1_09894 [Cercospora berteroae]
MVGYYNRKRTRAEEQKKENQARRVERRQQQLEHETAKDDPYYVPEGKGRKTNDFFLKYGLRERHYTLRDFQHFPPIVFWREQNVVPEEWDTETMAEKRKQLNHMLLSSDQVGWEEWGNMALFFTRAVQGIFTPSELVNRLEIFTWEQDVPERQPSLEPATYSAPASVYSESPDASARNNSSVSESRIPTDEPELENAEDFERECEQTTVLESDDIEEQSFTFGRAVYQGVNFTGHGTRDLTGDLTGHSTRDGNGHSTGDNTRDSTGIVPPQTTNHAHSPADPHRWMSDDRVLQMSNRERALFAERRLQGQPNFSEIRGVDDIPPPHPLFQEE